MRVNGRDREKRNLSREAAGKKASEKKKYMKKKKALFFSISLSLPFLPPSVKPLLVSLSKEKSEEVGFSL